MVAIMLAVVMVIGLIPNEAVLAADYLADLSTSTKYTESLGDNASTEYAGRVWTDKTVFSSDATFTGYSADGSLNEITVENDDDFLIAFSALATSQSISGQTQAPVDVVLIIDISGSMSNEDSNMDNGKSRIYNTIQATNNAIDELMALNPYTRVAVVAFSSNAQVLLPLDRYTKVVTTEREWEGGRWDGQWVEKEVVNPYFSLSRETGSSNNATLYTKAINSNNVTIDKNTSVSGGTNIQMGLYEGMQVLAEEEETTVTVNGNQLQRVPSVVLLSDGSPTYSSNSRSWWAPADNYNDGPGSAPYAGNGMKAILVGSYMKDAIDRNYEVTDTPLATTVYTIGMGITGLDADEKNLAYMTLDPGTCWNDADETNSMKTTIKQYWADYTRNNNTGTLNINVGKYEDRKYSDDYYALTHPNTGYDVDSNNGYNYVDDYYDADNANAVAEVFKQIVSDIAISTPQIPTEHDPARPALSGYITYTDPIGAYMEVKNMKSIIYAGEKYDFVAEGYKGDVIEDGNTTTYVFKQTAQGNEVYGTEELEHIIIEVVSTTDNYGIKSQVLTIKIPAALIPLRVNTISLNENGMVESHTNNGTYPIRVLYTVGLQEEVLSNGNVDLNKISAEYKAKNLNDDGTIDFYSNLYTGNKVNGVTVGNATASFDAAVTNPFYYMQEDMVIYKDSSFTEKATELLDEETYYYKEIYYHGTQVVTKATERTGAQLKQNTTVTKHEAEGYYYRPAGTVRANNMLTFEGTKVANATGTAADFYTPTYDGTTGQFVVYLGNNGVMSVEAAGSLEITKTVEAADGLTAPDKDFTFTVDLGGIQGTYAYIVTDASGNGVAEGTIVNGGTLTLKDGQTATILNLPPGTQYTVTETAMAGFATTSTGATGEIVAGQAVSARFTNAYSVEEITFDTNHVVNGKKVLVGRDWTEGDNFTFFLTAANNAPLPEGYDAAAGVTVGYGEDAKDNEVSFNFGTIKYTAPGLYRYTIVEKEPENNEYKPGMTYSRALYSLAVYVVDNGDGTLSATSNIQKLHADDATQLYTMDANNQIVMNPGQEAQDDAVFVNTYNADSVTSTPVAVKKYTDNSGLKPLVPGMFQFKLTPVGIVDAKGNVSNPSANPMPLDANGEKLTEAIASNEGENVTFPSVTFTQADVLNGDATTYRYQMEEILPSGANAENGYKVNGMAYDANKYDIDVTVSIDPESAEVTVNAVYPNEERIVTFRNVYTPEEVVLGKDTLAPIKGIKTLTGRDMLEGETFKFTLTSANDVTKQAIEEGTILLAKNEAEVANGKDGVVTTFDFGTTTFTKPGTYVFNIVETKGENADKGVTYDSNVCKVTVVVTDNKGKLEARVSYANTIGSDNSQAVFNNTYEATFDANTAINLNGTKTLTGRDIKEGEFYFAVKMPDGTVNYVPAAQNGTMKFLEKVTYTEAGTYTYEINEVIPKNDAGEVIDNGVTFDTSVYTVTVTVTDDFEGNLKAAITEIKKDDKVVALDTTIEFNNAYAPDDVVYDFLPLQKILSGERKDALKAGEFTFVRTAEPTDGIIFLDAADPTKEIAVTGEDIAANTADGMVIFGDIKFTKVGSYEVTIKEVIPEDSEKVAGVTYDAHELKATFVVTDDLNGNLVVRVTNLRGSQIFTNEYKTTGTLIGAANLEVTKILDVTDRTPNKWTENDVFTFVLEAADDVTKQAVAEGKVVLPTNAEGITIGKPADGGNTNTNAFGDIVFHAVGEYVFRIRELPGTEPGMDYDVTAHLIEVITSDKGNGELNVSLVPGSQINPDFKNVYNPEDVVLPGHGKLHVNKVFTGRPNNEWLTGDSFNFTLEAIGETLSKTQGTDPMVIMTETSLVVTKDNKDVAHFGNITFKAAGEYEFLIKEAAGNIAGVTYDTNMWKVIVTVGTETEGMIDTLVISGIDYQKLNVDGDLLEKVEDEVDVTFNNRYEPKEVTTVEEDIQIKVDKILTGRHWNETDAFEFILEAGNQTTIDALAANTVVLGDGEESMSLTIKGTDAEKTATFDKITFRAPGAYIFAIREVAGTDDKMTYDGQVDTVRLDVIDNGKGKLEITSSVVTGDMVWENKYTPDATTATIEAFKTISGRDMTENDIFRFHIAPLNEAAKSALPAQTEVANAPVAEGANKASIRFEAISFAEAGVYEYVISERPVSTAGITNDTGYIKVTVTVNYDEAEGKFDEPVVEYKKVNSEIFEGLANVFINKYTAEGFLDGSTHLKVTKRFTGRENNAWLEGDAFTFQLAANLADEATKNAMEAQMITLPENAAGITIAYADALKEKAFGSIKFTQTGTYQFVITEVVPDGESNGITYDTDLDRIITVIVTDNGDGTLTATVKEGSDSLTFNNCYDTKETVLIGETYLVVEKQIVGREWITNDTYSFTLEANMDHPLTKDALEAQEPTILMPNELSVTITKDTEGHKAAFGDITFKEPGTYKFMVKENIPTEDKITGITYDNRTKHITVVVTDNHDGTMTATATVDNHQNLVFVNTYAAAATDVVTFTGVKEMVGRDLKDTDDFEFTITAVDGGPLPAETTVVNTDDGTITFAPIKFEKAGTYKYEIKETGGNAPGVTNAGNTVEVTVTVTDNYEAGKLEAKVSYSEGGFKFTNTYEATGVDVVVKGDKIVTSTPGNNYTMVGGDFQFEIVPSTSNPTEDPIKEATEVTNTAAGEITFIDTNYTVSGEYIYTVYEKDGTVAGITEDNAVYTITVKISDSTDGYLVKEVMLTKEDEGVDTVVFENKYNPEEATAIFSGKKVLDSIHKTELEDKLFTFKLVGKDNAPMPESDEAKNDTSGFFQFGTITYTKPGTYEYTITEVDGKEDGYIYDTKTYDVIVTVTDEEGILKAEVVGITDAEGNPVVVFTNDYVPDSVKLEGDTALKGNKKLTGRDLAAGEFEFVLSAEEGTPMPENEAVSNDKNGNFAFGTIEFTKAGTYYYIISETDNNLAGVDYDETAYTVKVEVTDKGGYLEAEVTYLVEEDAKDNVRFENTYEANPIINYSIWAKKTLSGRDLNEKEFTFTLEGEDIEPQTKTNDADGMVEFVIPEYDKAGDYVYTITEEVGEKGGITYDASVYEVTVTVTDNTVEGKLEAEITKVEKTADGETSEVEAVEFTNAYDAADTSIILTGKKNLTGRDLAAGEFTFLLKNEEGEVIAKATNKADGTITFEKFDFTQTGTFKYTIVEDASAKAANITYDDTVYEVVIEVTDDLEGKLVAKVVSQDEIIFNNLYEAIEVPETGDSSAIAMWLVLALVSFAGCAGVVLRRTRR